MRNRFQNLLRCAFALSLGLFASIAGADPTMVTYQGRLTTADTQMPIDATVSMTLSLYDVATEGVALWTETKDVTVENGLFTTLLGDTAALDSVIFDGRDLYLGIGIDGGPEMSPRQLLSPTPYALHSENSLNRIGPDTMTGSSTDPVLTVEQSGAGAGVNAVSMGNFGVRGESNLVGVLGVTNSTVSDAYGVHGMASSTQLSAGVRGDSSYVGVWGESSGRWGVYGRTNGASNSYGVYGSAGNGSGNFAGYFAGDVNVVGTISKSGGGFKIDHPLDPANKYLHHSFVESPDMMNVYNGNVTLDGNGEAVVELPEWFEALNRDFRYQLTAIGAPAPGLYIAEEVSGNQFKIGGGPAAVRVSWQVTGIRKDPFAEANRIPVEEPKSGNEKGTVLHSESKRNLPDGSDVPVLDNGPGSDRIRPGDGAAGRE